MRQQLVDAPIGMHRQLNLECSLGEPPLPESFLLARLLSFHGAITDGSDVTQRNFARLLAMFSALSDVKRLKKACFMNDDSGGRWRPGVTGCARSSSVVEAGLVCQLNP
jgi:hypothetical protein